eukprot:COSAG03_NODE_1755_length_3568_cov_4.499568_2_plen_50_part_00
MLARETHWYREEEGGDYVCTCRALAEHRRPQPIEPPAPASHRPARTPQQ